MAVRPPARNGSFLCTSTLPRAVPRHVPCGAGPIPPCLPRRVRAGRMHGWAAYLKRGARLAPPPHNGSRFSCRAALPPCQWMTSSECHRERGAVAEPGQRALTATSACYTATRRFLLPICPSPSGLPAQRLPARRRWGGVGPGSATTCPERFLPCTSAGPRAVPCHVPCGFGLSRPCFPGRVRPSRMHGWAAYLNREAWLAPARYNGWRFSCGERAPPQHNSKWFHSLAAGNVVEQGALAAERRQLQALVRQHARSHAGLSTARHDGPGPQLLSRTVRQGAGPNELSGCWQGRSD